MDVTTLPPTISVHDVRVARGGHVVLGVDRLEIHAGITALIGPNGSGKSTLLHVLGGVLAPLDGTVEIRDCGRLHNHVAYVLQHQAQAASRPITAHEVVTLGVTQRRLLRPLTRAQRSWVAEVMERMEVADLANRFLSDMSGGQRQRVFIAQALAQDADILLLDEPFTGLDLASSATIDRELRAERDRGRTVVVATHDLSDAAEADFAVLVAGRIVAAGPPSEVLTSTYLREAYEGRILDLDGTHVALDDGAHHHDHPSHDHPGHDHAGHDHPGHDHPEHDHAGHPAHDDHTHHSPAGHDHRR